MNKKKDSVAHPVDVYVGKRLRQKRLENGISQDELANSVGLTFQQIQKYEKGLNRVSSSKLFDFANFLKTDIKYFFDGLSNDYNTQGASSEMNKNSYYLNDSSIAEYGASAVSTSDAEINDLVSAYKSIKNHQIRRSVMNIIRKLNS